jgi:type II secretory pathway component PulF
MQFIYKGVNREGHTISGRAEAADKQSLIALLRRQNVQPFIVEPDKQKHLMDRLFGPKKKVRLNDLVIFTRQLSTYTNAHSA